MSTEPRALVVWVPTNRRDNNLKPTHMDGWNEIIAEYKRSRYHGAMRELDNVEWVASYVREAMQSQGWKPMDSDQASNPCSVFLGFVERNRRRDVGNIHGGAKYALDALTHRNLSGACAIYDDSQRWMPTISYGIECDPSNPGLLITITKLERHKRGNNGRKAKPRG